MYMHVAAAANAAMSAAGVTALHSQPTRTLVTTYPYDISRNPLYLSITGMFVGGAILLNSRL
jgi:protein-S-isoprenylcysteine O-methyltransferase Ste14